MARLKVVRPAPIAELDSEVRVKLCLRWLAAACQLMRKIW